MARTTVLGAVLSCAVGALALDNGCESPFATPTPIVYNTVHQKGSQLGRHSNHHFTACTRTPSLTAILVLVSTLGQHPLAHSATRACSALGSIRIIVICPVLNTVTPQCARHQSHSPHKCERSWGFACLGKLDTDTLRILPHLHEHDHPRRRRHYRLGRVPQMG